MKTTESNPRHARLRPMSALYAALCIILLSAWSGCADRTPADNTLSRQEVREGWQLLFDGETPQGWRGIRTGTFPESGWTIGDGALTIAANDDNSSVGDIITDRKYRNFELSADFLYTDGANSGIKYFINERADGLVSSVGCEYQILDDLLHPDAARGTGGNRKMGSLYDVLPAALHTPPEAGEWHTAKLVVDGRHVEHWLDGKKILSYERGSAPWTEAVARSKFGGVEGWGLADEGYILLQDHGQQVSFKNIKIREL